MATIQRSQADVALARVVADEIGPRQRGVIYDNVDGIFEVLDVNTNLSEVRRILKRRAAQFAITVINLRNGEKSIIGSVWTGTDRVLKAVA